jgi:Domain of unknown function (DUF4440)
MDSTRRDLATEEAAVAQAVEALRQATLAQDGAKLETLIAAELSYGHSTALVQNKEKAIDGIMTRPEIMKSLEFPGLTVTVADNAAIARHVWVSNNELDGKPLTIKIGILTVWLKQDGSWKLLARQGYKLP